MSDAKNEAKPKPQPKHHHEGKDHLRAFEHLGRVEVLAEAAGKPQKDIAMLIDLAHKELHAGHAKEAADLLRAAEHLSFAALGKADGKAPPPVEDAAHAEIEHLLEKADEHWSKDSHRHPEVATLFQSSVEHARAAAKKHHHRQALELARGAEALAHVKLPKPHDKPVDKAQS